MVKRETAILLTLGAVQFTHVVDFMIMMPLGPQLMRLFQITPQEFSFLVSAYTLSAGVSGFLATFWMDRVDRKLALLGLYLCFLLGTLACALAPSYLFLALARIATGAFGGLMTMLVMAIVGDVIPEHRRGAAMGVVMSSFAAASVFGVPFGLYLANLYSWHWPFFVLVGISLVVLALIQGIIPSISGHMASKYGEKTPSPAATLAAVANDPNQLRTLAFTFLLTAGHFSIVPFLSPSMVANVGFTEHDLTWIYLIGGGATIFTSPIVGRLSDRVGRAKVYIIGVSLSCLPILFLTHLGQVPLGVALGATTLFFISSSGRFIPASAIATTVVDPRRRGTFMSLNSCVQQLASGISAYVAGLIVVRTADGHLANYEIVGYLAVFASVLSLFLVRKIRSREAEVTSIQAALAAGSRPVEDSP